MFVIVRVEPVEKKKDVQDLFAKKDKKPQPYQAAVASGAQGAPLSVPELIADLRNEVRRLKSEEQFSATTEESHASMLIRTVAEHGKAAVPALTEVLVKEPGLQFCILDALRRIGSDAASAVQTVADLAKGTNDEVRAQAIGTLGKIANSSPVAITALTNALSDSFQPVRATAVRSLAEIGPAAKDAMPALIQAWGTEANTSVRKGIIDAFGLIGSNAEAAVPVLMAVLKDKDPSLRWGAARSLGRIGPGAVKALPALESVAADEADYIRKEVLATIRSIRQGDEKKDNTGSNQVPEDTARVLADPQH
jgi:HEAT repeat protein